MIYPKTWSETPRCFTFVQYEEWKSMIRQSLGRGETLTVCDDCTPQFEAQQRALCRCEKAAWTDFVFGKPDNRFFEGGPCN
jgi:hypothetical protein